MPAVSVIVPAYKARNYLADALDSVASQTFTDWEILVIDDCSPEPIDDILSDFTRKTGHVVRLIRHETNQGLGGARNTGIREAAGEWIALLDHDDLWAPGHLDSLVQASARDSADLAFCTVKQFRDQPDDELGTWGPRGSIPAPQFPLALFEYSFITPSATLIRRTRLLEAGGFDTDPRLHMCEDLDLWLRLLHRGARFTHVPNPTCYYRKHSEAATARAGYMAYQAAWVRQKHAAHVPGSWLNKKSIVAYRWWQAWLAYLGIGQRRWDILARALWHGLPVPLENLRGMVRTFRRLIR